MPASSSAADELAIRTLRAAFNRAIAARDAQAIAPILARDCVMMTGTDSAVIAGRMAQVKVWRREFSAPSPAIYVRTPSQIIVSAVEPLAMEEGTWQGLDGAGGAITSSGSYCAKWREVGGQWLIEAEIFVTLA